MKRSNLRNPNYLSAALVEFDSAARKAQQTRTISSSDVEARLEEREAEWRAANPVIQRSRSSDEVRRMLKPAIVRELAQDHETSLRSLAEARQKAQAAYTSVRAELGRIPEPSAAIPPHLPAVGVEAEMLTTLRLLVNQNAQIDARQRADRIVGGIRATFDAMREAEAAGDFALAAELDARIDAMPPGGPTDAHITERMTVRNQLLPAHREARIPAAERERLDAANARLAEIDALARPIITLAETVGAARALEITD